jgi:mRNA-degrading endonuclease toxin of MazEF toxin-antitoxin module
MAGELKPLRCQIWDVNLDPTRGEEIGGHREGETRPVIVLSLKGKGRPSIRVCVPLTEFQDAHAFLRWCVLFLPDVRNGLSKVSTADTSQIRALDQVRFVQKRGRIEEHELKPVFAALGVCLGFEVPSSDETA